MKTELLDLLSAPQTHAALKYVQSKQVLVDAISGKEYAVKDNIPILLPDREDDSLEKTTHHKKSGANFNYIEHYQNDADFFDYTEQHDSAANRHEDRRLHEAIVNEINRGDVAVLDVGCGRAWLAETLCKRKAIKLVSMDISYTNPKKALQNFPYPNHYAVVADVFAIPFAENTFDYIVASEIIEHIADPSKFIAILYQLLKPGGKLIITTPHNEKLQYSLCVHCNHPTPHHAHLHSFTKANFKAFLPADKKDATIKTFSNKLLIKSRSHVLLQFLPYKLWKGIDAFCNKIFGSPMRLMAVLGK